MSPVASLPARGQVFLDARGGDRALRVSWHPEADLVVLSIWHGSVCAATLRLRRSEVPVLIDALAQGLADGMAGRAGRDSMDGAAVPGQRPEQDPGAADWAGRAS